MTEKYDNETLNERAITHGRWDVQSNMAQRIKKEFTLSVNWEKMKLSQRESLELIATKLSRILNGNPNHKDSWDDIAGYAQLISKELED